MIVLPHKICSSIADMKPKKVFKLDHHVNDLVLLDRFILITIIPSSLTEPPATSP